MKRIWWMSFWLITASPAGAAGDCVTTLNEPGVRAEECAANGKKEISLRLGEKNAFALRVDFDPSVNEAMFSGIRPLGASRPLRAEDQSALRAAAAKVGEARLSPEARGLVKFLVGFAPPGFSPAARDLTGPAKRHRPNAFAQTTILCEKLGQLHTGYFTARGQAWKQTMVLGSHGCMGKCGPGCGVDGRWDQGQYTQECFNHDLCTVMTNENMGDCADEFWEAANGFLTAPMCMFVPIEQG